MIRAMVEEDAARVAEGEYNFGEICQWFAQTGKPKGTIQNIK